MKGILTANGHDANEDLFSDRVATGGSCGSVSTATPRLCNAAVTLKSSDSKLSPMASVVVTVARMANGMMRVNFISETLGALEVWCRGVAETVIKTF